MEVKWKEREIKERNSKGATFFLSVFLGWRKPNLITGPSGWWGPNESRRTQKTGRPGESFGFRISPMDTDNLAVRDPWTWRWGEESRVVPYASELDTAAQPLQHTATHCNTLHHAAPHCSTLQHTATHCNTTRYCGSESAPSWPAGRPCQSWKLDLMRLRKLIRFTTNKGSSLQCQCWDILPSSANSMDPLQSNCPCPRKKK